MRSRCQFLATRADLGANRCETPERQRSPEKKRATGGREAGRREGQTKPLRVHPHPVQTTVRTRHTDAQKRAMAPGSGSTPKICRAQWQRLDRSRAVAADYPAAFTPTADGGTRRRKGRERSEKRRRSRACANQPSAGVRTGSHASELEIVWQGVRNDAYPNPAGQGRKGQGVHACALGGLQETTEREERREERGNQGEAQSAGRPWNYCAGPPRHA